MQVLVFVSSHCPHCPKAVSVARKVIPEYSGHDVRLRKIRLKTSEGKKLSDEYDVRVTPTTFILNGEGKVTKKMTGVPSEGDLKKEIEKALGIRKSIISRLADVF
jgi:thiol-disulfide isomerase/thioredoxin